MIWSRWDSMGSRSAASVPRLYLTGGLIAATAVCGHAVKAEPPQNMVSELTAPGPEGALSGTMVVPDPGHDSGPRVVVLIVPGSGPTDRDGNSPLGVTARPYVLLAEGLADRGIPSVRIDKRGMFASSRAVADPNAVTLSDYADDIVAWSQAIGLSFSGRTDDAALPCLVLAGHSEGGLVSLVAAPRLANLCGLVLLATPGRPTGEVLRDQLRANFAEGTVLDAALAAITSLEAGQSVDVRGLHPALRSLFAPGVQGFLIDLMSRDPAQLASVLTVPTLVLQGKRDLQIKEGNAVRLSEALDRGELVLLPDVNHVLKTVASDDRAANLATYADPSLPLAPGVTKAVADFVDRVADR